MWRAATLRVLACVVLVPVLTACPGHEESNPGVQRSGYAAQLTLDFTAGNGSVFILTNVGDKDDTYTITVEGDGSATITPDETFLPAGKSDEVGAASLDYGAVIVVTSAGSGEAVATYTVD